MAGQRKGNILYEVLILILAVVLLATILYPSKVWKGEEELQNICRTRMESIQEMQLRYITKVGRYSTDIPEVVKTVFSDPETKAVFDTLLFWDGMVTQKELKHIVFQKLFPEDLRTLIRDKFNAREPIHNLGNWDSLQIRLLGLFKESLGSIDPSKKAALDTSVIWPSVFGEEMFDHIINTAGIPTNTRNRIKTEIRRGKPIYQTTGWEQLRPIMVDSMKKVVRMAERTDTYTKDEQGVWEEMKKKEWSAEMDRTTPEWRDSLWQTLKQKFWESEKEVIWKKVRKKLWKTEQTAWAQSNEAMWKRIMNQNWETGRKKVWEEESAKTLAGTALARFTAKKDSIWKAALEEIRSKEYSQWEKKNSKLINETILNLWERDRRVSWFDENFIPYTEQKIKQKDVVWIQMKDDRWGMEKIRFWKDEEVKLENKATVWKRLDASVHWAGVVPAERIESLIQSLRLPDKKDVWKSIQSAKDVKGSVLYHLGLEGLVGKSLIDSLYGCPLSHTPYQVHAMDTSVVKSFGIRCPIIDSTRTKFALKIDPTTEDTTRIELKLPVLQDLFGGGSIQNHGTIDEEGKKSWEKRGR